MLKKKGSGHVGEVLIPSSANLQPPETDIQMPFWGETYLDGIAALCPCRKPTGRWRYRDGKTAAGETPTGDTDVPSRNRHPNVRFQSNYSLVNRGNMRTAPLRYQLTLTLWGERCYLVLVVISPLIINPSSQKKGYLLILFFLSPSPVTTTSSQKLPI